MKIMVIKIETYHFMNILTKFKLLENIIINLQNSDACKIQLTIAITFISSKDSEEERVMHSVMKCHKVNFICGGSYISSPDWIKKKKATVNPKNTDNKSFEYIATVALNYEEIESHPERVSNIKPFINKYNWEGINYPSKINDWKRFKKNNPTIALNILYTKEKNMPSLYLKN